MIPGTELGILKTLFGDLTKEYTIRGLSKALELPYPQVHRSVQSLSGRGLVKKTKKGRSSFITLDFESFKEEYLITELERRRDKIDRHEVIGVLDDELDRAGYNQFICVLFGSYAGETAKKDSDIDLLFVIPGDYDYGKFEKSVKSAINIPKADIHITTEEGLLEMWSTPLKFNIGNELLKKHIILRGAESFLRLRRRYYVG